MLVLRRKIGETVRIAGGITVHVNDIRSGTVQLGFDAPREVKIIRGELSEPAPLEMPLGAATPEIGEGFC